MGSKLPKMATSLETEWVGTIPRIVARNKNGVKFSLT